MIGHPALNKGLWVLAGLLIFIVLEKVFTSIPGKIDVQKTASDVNVKQENVYVLNNNIKELVNRHENDHHTNLKRSNAHEQKALLNPIKSTTIKVNSFSIRL